MTEHIKKTNFRYGALIALAFAAVASPAGAADAPAIRHRFLAVDESRAQLLLVDQYNPEKCWALPLPVKCRDYQLIGNNQILLNASDGYYVYDLGTRARVKELHESAYNGTYSVRRLANGHTLVGCNQQCIRVYELDASDALVNTAVFPTLANLRLMRLSPAGTLLMGANDSVVEAEMTGNVLGRLPLPAPVKHIYQVLRLPNGNALASTGYGHFLAEVDPAGDVVRRIAPPESTPENLYYFFAGFQLLKNGHIVQCNWTGHGAQDSTKGVQLMEFDPAGKVVWTWHDAQLAGSVHGVIVLDDLDTHVLNDDSSGALQALPSRP